MNDLHGSLRLQQALLFIFMQIQTYKLAFLLFLYMVDIIILIFFTWQRILEIFPYQYIDSFIFFFFF